MVTTQYYLKEPQAEKPTPINLFIYYGAPKPIKFAAKESVHPKEWNPEKQRIREVRSVANAVQRNLWLDKVEKGATEVYRRLMNDGAEITEDVFKLELKIYLGLEERKKKMSFREFIAFYAEKRKQDNATDWKIARMLKNKLYAFMDETRVELTFDAITIDFKTSFVAFMERKGHKKNGISTLFSIFRSMMESAFVEKHHTNPIFSHPQFGHKSEIVRKEPLTYEEIMAVFNADLSEFNKSYDEIRDAFLIGLCGAMRFSDYSALFAENFSDNEIHRKHKKTSKNIVAPMHWMVKEILKKYNGRTPPHHDIRYANAVLKDILRHCGVDKLVVVSYTKGGKRIDEVLPKYETVTTHFARKSGINSLIESGVSIARAMEISGHDSYDSFKRYYGFDARDNAKFVAETSSFYQRPTPEPSISSEGGKEPGSDHAEQTIPLAAGAQCNTVPLSGLGLRRLSQTDSQG